MLDKVKKHSNNKIIIYLRLRFWLRMHVGQGDALDQIQIPAIPVGNTKVEVDIEKFLADGADLQIKKFSSESQREMRLDSTTNLPAQTSPGINIRVITVYCYTVIHRDFIIFFGTLVQICIVRIP